MNWTLLLNSLLVAGSTTALAVAVGFLAAIWIAGLEARWQRLVSMFTAVALALPSFLVTNCWLDLAGTNGAWRRWFPLTLESPAGAAWVLSLLFWPIPLFLALAALRRVDAPLLEVEPAARGWRLLRWLLWPVARPAVGLGATIVFVLALNQFAVPTILQVKVFPAEMWIRYSTNLDAAGAWALSWPLIVAPLLLLLRVRRAPAEWPQATTGATARALRRQLGPGAGATLGSLTLLGVGLSVVLPLAQLACAGRTWLELPSVLRAVPGTIGQSFGLAAVTATLCLGLAAVTWRCRAAALLWLPFLVPGALLGIAMIEVFNRPMFAALYGTTALVVVAFVLRYAALAQHAVGHAVRGLDRDVTDAARLEGARGWTMWRHVHAPLVAAPAAAAWYVTYLVCLWDVETLVLIQPPGGETLALRAFNLLHYGHGAQVNALCVILLGLAVAPLAGWWIWQAAAGPWKRSAN